MPIRVTVKHQRRADTLDARLLVARCGDVAAQAMRSALIEGINPDTNSPRRINSAGKPEGYRTGRLANGIRRTAIQGDKIKASTTIVPPADRAGWVASRGDVLIADGNIGDAIQAAADEFASKA